MTNQPTNKNRSDLIKRIIAWLSAPISLIAVVVNFINYIKGNAGWSFLIIVTSVGVILWASLFYIYKSTINIPEANKNRTKKSHRNRTSSLHRFFPLHDFRKFALVSIMSVVITTVVTVVAYQYFHTPEQISPLNKIVILVIGVKGSDQQTQTITGAILDQLRSYTEKYPEVQIRTSDENVDLIAEEKSAVDLGRANEANIVIWGTYTKTADIFTVSLNFKVLELKGYSPLQQLKNNLDIPDSDLTRFSIQTQLSKLDSFEIQTHIAKDMSYLLLKTIGLARLESQDFSGAIDRFTNALDTSDLQMQSHDYEIVLTYRGLTYSLKGDYDRALMDLNQAIRLNPQNPWSYSYRGYIYSLKGSYDKAIEEFSQAISLKPDYAVVYHNRANAYYTLGNYDRAIADYNYVIRLNPSDSNSYYNRAIVYEAIGSYDQALDDYKKAIEINPSSYDAYYNLGITYANKGDFEQAIKNFSVVINLESDYVPAYLNRGKAYLEKRDKENAMADFKKVLELSDKDDERQEAAANIKKLDIK